MGEMARPGEGHISGALNSEAARPQVQVSDAWRTNHSFLVYLAFGMLGDIGAAEDTVQAAFARLAKRARTKIQCGAGRPEGELSLRQHRQVAEKFIQACRSGAMSTLIEILDPGIWGDTDLGPLDRRDGRSARGQQGVGANLLRYFGPSTTTVSYTVGGQPAVLAFVERSLWAVILLTVDHQLVKRIHVIADPVKVAFFNDQPAFSG